MSLHPDHAGDAERQLRQELDAADRRMQALVHGISHDLRAPLRAIDGFVARLARQMEAGDPAAADSLERIRAAASRMGSLIDGMLELARAGRAPLRPARVDVSMLAEWCLAELQDTAPDRQVRVAVQPGLEMVGDERLLKVMLGELLGNAWRFCASRDCTEIAVTGTRDGDGLALAVRDNGIGFDMTYAGKLLEPFQRLHGSEEGAGNGIGLAIAEQIAARHGGGISADAVVDAGATFRVRLRDLAAEPA